MLPFRPLPAKFFDMPSPTDFPTTGKVTAVLDGTVVFNPRGTTYQLHLKTAGRYTGPVNAPVEAVIRATGRKIWSVPSGGNFITPIVGPPKIVQGRVKHLDERFLVLQAGANVVVELPSADSAIDLASGAITIGMMVNATTFPGATFELAGTGSGSGVDQVSAVANQQ